MTISKDLFLAILAMDSYNRGYGAGIKSADATKDQGLTGAQTGQARVVQPHHRLAEPLRVPANAELS